MRQMFLLLVSAMVIAFSLSWASSGSTDNEFIVPDEVILPIQQSAREQLEISTSIALNDFCEKIESLHQEVRGAKIILSIKISHTSGQVCLQQIRSNIAVNFVLENLQMNSSRQVDVYFREGEESLKYFGSIALR
jgi:hypothetical protein